MDKLINIGIAILVVLAFVLAAMTLTYVIGSLGIEMYQEVQSL